MCVCVKHWGEQQIKEFNLKTSKIPTAIRPKNNRKKKKEIDAI